MQYYKLLKISFPIIYGLKWPGVNFDALILFTLLITAITDDGLISDQEPLYL